MKLPDYLEIAEKVDAGEKMTALESFIYSNEPASPEEVQFRQELAKVVSELTGAFCDPNPPSWRD